MKYLIVLAHPEPTSLNHQLKDRGVVALEQAGHEVVVCDLYKMNWKAVADADDFPERNSRESALNYSSASRDAYASGKQAPDIAEEQAKLLWADVVVIQFPLWWYGMPAILKGWFDRVYAFGFAYGVGPHGGANWGKRFGEGTLEKKRAVVAMTVGGRMAQYGPRGVNGAIDELLWPVQHGLLFYPGMTVMPPIVFYEVGRADEAGVAQMMSTYSERLLTIDSTEPVHMRSQNGGDYNDVQVLRDEFSSSLPNHALHQSSPAFVSNTWLGVSGDYTRRHIAPTSRDASPGGVRALVDLSRPSNDVLKSKT